LRTSAEDRATLDPDALRTRRRLIGAVTAVALLWMLIATLRHLRFGSSLFDLGLFDQIVWNTAHGRAFECSVHRRHFLADHFGPMLALLAPAYRVFSSPLVLCAADVLCATLAAIPLHAAARARGLSEGAAALLVGVFLAYPSLTSIAVYDFHPDMLALPWLMAALFFEAGGRLRAALACAVAALLCKEEYAIWCAMFGLFIALRRRQDDPGAARVGLAFSAAALVYLVLVMRVVIPSFDPQGFVQFSRYAYLGQGPRGIAHNLVAHPGVFVQQIGIVKVVHLIVTFAALAFLPLRAPRYLLLCLPTWGYNLLSTHENQAFIHYQNVVPILPPLFFATIEALVRRAPEGPAPSAALIARRMLPLLALAPLNLLVAGAVQWFMWVRHPRPVAAEVAEVALALPAGASLSTTNALGPHFSERRGLTMYPSLRPLGTGDPVDFVLLPLGPGGWRYSADGPAEMAALVRQTEAEGYAPVAVAGHVALLARGAPADAVMVGRLDALLRAAESPARR
jgi:uncharacterized membrane protein